MIYLLFTLGFEICKCRKGAKRFLFEIEFTEFTENRRYEQIAQRKRF